jgi:catechol 2,3-dioxygenase-like lactoylglutathione lyase family enzyme
MNRHAYILYQTTTAMGRCASIENMPPLGRLLESSIYVDPLGRAVEFYERLFGFEKLFADDRFCAFNVSGQQALLLFQKGATTKPIAIPGGIIPPHDGHGQTHFAFTIPAGSDSEWLEHLKANGVGIESRVEWPRGGCSLYFRDPDGHLLELITPGCWIIY